MDLPAFLPSVATDCHAHVFEPDRFPYAAQRAYTPPPAPLDGLRQLHARLGVGRVVLVQASVHGSDNSGLVDAVQRLGTDRARGIAVVDLATVTDGDLQALHHAGIRGVRLNLHVQGGSADAARAQVRLAQRLRALPGWNLQVHASLDLIVALLDELQALELPVVLDHHAGGPAADAAGMLPLQHLLQALARGHLWIKLSAPYRLPAGRTTRTALQLARAFHAVRPDRLLWGSDWPHTGGSGARGGDAQRVEPFRTVDVRQDLNDLLAALPDDDARHALLVRNPAALYGFSS